MILKQVEIFEFKSIKHIKMPINEIICLVGKNECGKTNILEAISFLNFYDNQFKENHTLKTSKRYRKGFPMISGLFSIEVAEYNFLSQYGYPDKDFELIKSELLKFPRDNKFVEIKRWGNSFNDIELNIVDKDFKGLFKPLDYFETNKDKNEFLEKFFNDFYPTIEFFTDEEFTIEPASTEELLSNDKEFESFRRLLKVGGIDDLLRLEANVADVTELTTEVEENLNQLFSKYYLQDKSIRIMLRENKGKWNIVIQDSTKKSYNLIERSPGFQYFFAFIINKYYLNGNSDKNSIYLLDEPGKSLHPRGAKDLLKAFKDVADKSQIMYTTHNAFLAVRDKLDNLLLVTKNSKDGTSINLKPYRNKYEVLRKELGILLNDSFILSDINLLVEGASEKFTLHSFFNDSNNNELEWLNILNCESVSEIRPTVRYLNNLGYSGIILVDSDDAGQNLLDNPKFKNLTKDRKKWQVIELNDVFTDKKSQRTFEDLFPNKYYIKAYNKYYQDHKEDIEFDVKEFVPLDENKKLKPPIINSINTHFKEYCSGSINKITIIRNCIQLIENEKNKNELLDNLYKLSNLIGNKAKSLIK